MQNQTQKCTEAEHILSTAIRSTVSGQYYTPTFPHISK